MEMWSGPYTPSGHMECPSCKHWSFLLEGHQWHWSIWACRYLDNYLKVNWYICWPLMQKVSNRGDEWPDFDRASLYQIWIIERNIWNVKIWSTYYCTRGLFQEKIDLDLTTLLLTRLATMLTLQLSITKDFWMWVLLKFANLKDIAEQNIPQYAVLESPKMDPIDAEDTCKIRSQQCSL